MIQYNKEKQILNQPEILEIKERLQKLEEQISKETSVENKEKIFKEEIKKYLQEAQETPTFAAPTAKRDEVQEIADFEPNQQVGALISLALEKGLSYAISVVRALDNPAILDEFHDTLVDRYYDILVQKGVLKNGLGF